MPPDLVSVFKNIECDIEESNTLSASDTELDEFLVLNDINTNRVCRQNDIFVSFNKTNPNEISFTHHDIFAVVVGS